MKYILSIILSLKMLLALCQNAGSGHQVNHNLRKYSTNYMLYPLASNLLLKALKDGSVSQPSSMTVAGEVAITGMTYNTLSTVNSLYIVIDPVNGDDTKKPSEYTVQSGSFTGGVAFKSLDKAIEWINGSSGFYYYVGIRNATSANPVILSSVHKINNKYVTLYSADYATLSNMVLNARLFASTGTMLQLSNLDLTLNDSNLIALDGAML